MVLSTMLISVYLVKLQYFDMLLGKLVLKIPWKNLYNAPVVASVERLFLLVVPHRDGKEGFLNNVVMQAQLQKLEFAKKLRKEKGECTAGNAIVLV